MPLTLKMTEPLTSVTAKLPSDMVITFLTMTRSTGYCAQNCCPTTVIGFGNGWQAVAGIATGPAAIGSVAMVKGLRFGVWLLLESCLLGVKAARGYLL